MAYVKKRRVYKKRPYVRKAKRTGVKKMVSTIVKRMMPPVEKKRISAAFSATDYTMGQVAGNANAYYAADVTPLVSQGDAVNQRAGSLISVCSLHMTLQLRQMSAATSPVKITFYLVYCRGFNTLANIVPSLWNTNNYIGVGTQIYDTGSDMNIDNIANYRILKKFNAYLKPDQFTGQQMPLAKTVGLKFRKPLNVRYDGNNNTVNNGSLHLVAFASNGNASTATASTLANVPVTAINTGQFINYNIKFYYTDL